MRTGLNEGGDEVARALLAEFVSKKFSINLAAREALVRFELGRQLEKIRHPFN